MAGNRGRGRPKGARNRITKDLRDLIVGALKAAGGEDYLVRQANENPSAFLTLLGKVVPKEVSASVEYTMNPLEQLLAEIDGAGTGLPKPKTASE